MLILLITLYFLLSPRRVEESARTVSAATVEGHGTSLTIQLAGNQTPSEEVLRGLEEILGIVQAYATKGLPPISNRQEFGCPADD